MATETPNGGWWELTLAKPGANLSDPVETTALAVDSLVVASDLFLVPKWDERPLGGLPPWIASRINVSYLRLADLSYLESMWELWAIKIGEDPWAHVRMVRGDLPTAVIDWGVNFVLVKPEFASLNIKCILNYLVERYNLSWFTFIIDSCRDPEDSVRIILFPWDTSDAIRAIHWDTQSSWFYIKPEPGWHIKKVLEEREEKREEEREVELAPELFDFELWDQATELVSWFISWILNKIRWITYDSTFSWNKCFTISYRSIWWKRVVFTIYLEDISLLIDFKKKIKELSEDLVPGKLNLFLGWLWQECGKDEFKSKVSAN